MCLCKPWLLFITWPVNIHCSAYLNLIGQSLVVQVYKTWEYNCQREGNILVNRCGCISLPLAIILGYQILSVNPCWGRMWQISPSKHNFTAICHTSKAWFPRPHLPHDRAGPRVSTTSTGAPCSAAPLSCFDCFAAASIPYLGRLPGPSPTSSLLSAARLLMYFHWLCCMSLLQRVPRELLSASLILRHK